MKAYKFNTVVAALILAALLVGCEKKKDLSPPPVNQAASDAVKLTISFNNPGDAVRYSVNLKAEYGNLALECSNVQHLKGGSVDYPHGYVDIKSDDGNTFVIYRDHFVKREVCPWKFFGVGIYVHDLRANYTNVAAYTDNELIKGFEQEAACGPPSSEGFSSCLRREILRVPSRLTFKIRVND